MRSLDVVEQAVRREADALEHRAVSVDSRAGLVLGFSGLLVSLAPGNGWPPLALTARILAAAAALAALRAFARPLSGNVELAHILDRIDADPVSTRVVVLDVTVAVNDRASAVLRVKLARLRLATIFLTAAIAAAVAGAIVGAWA